MVETRNQPFTNPHLLSVNLTSFPEISLVLHLAAESPNIVVENCCANSTLTGHLFVLQLLNSWMLSLDRSAAVWGSCNQCPRGSPVGLRFQNSC